MELGWEIRTTSGTRLVCPDVALTTVALCARPTNSTMPDAPCPHVTVFPCNDGHGATRFELAPGQYELSITPGCADGMPARATVPPPLVRDILNGRVAELNDLLILVPGASTCEAGR